MSSEKEKSTWKESPARVGTSVKNEKFPWKAFTFLALLTICLLTLFTHSIWKTVTDLEAQRKLTCESVKGNSDMYGLGIRLGVYMQLVVSAFVDSFGNQQYSSGLVASTLWFLFALSVALSMVLYNPASHSSEVYIIISLGNAVTAVMLSKMAKFNPLTSSESYLLALGRVVLWGVWRASTSVYWWTLIHDNYVEGSDSCGTWGWIFYKVDLNGPFRTFNQATNVLEWIILGSFLLSYLIGAIIFLFHLWRIEWPAGKDIRKADGGGRTKSKEEMRRVPASKFTIACDYAFVSIGKLRQTLYGVDETGNRLATPAASDVENPPPSIASDAENAQKNARSASKEPDLLTARLKEHIEAHYTKQEVSGRIGVREATGSKFPTYHLIRVYWDCRDKVQRHLGETGFKTIKIPLLLLFDIATVAYTILNVEFSLRINNIDDIYDMWSVGQLIPVIIGAGGMGVAAAELYVYQREKSLGIRWRSVDIKRIEAPNSETKETETPNETRDKKTESTIGEASQCENIETSLADITPVDVDEK